MRLSVRLRDLFGFGHVHLDGPLRSSSFFFLDRRRLQFLRHFPGLKTQEISYFFLQKRPRLGYIFPHFATCTSILDLACSSGSFSTSGKRSSPRSRMWYLYCVERKCRKSSSADHKKSTFACSLHRLVLLLRVRIPPYGAGPIRRAA